MRAEAVARLERGCGGYAGLAAASLGPPAALAQCCRQLIHAATAHTVSRRNHTAFLGAGWSVSPRAEGTAHDSGSLHA
jgi:hypothetical protein